MAGNLTTQVRSGSWGAALALSTALMGCTGMMTDSSGTPSTSTGGSGQPNPVGSGGSGSSGTSTTTTTPGGGSAGSSSSTTTTVADKCVALNPLTRRLWRLSVEQYQNAVRDLLGLTTAPQLTNRGGEAQEAFFGDASLSVADDFEYALYQVVDGLLPTLPASLTACTAGEAANACATRIATKFGAKAFRRPLTSVEIAALVSNPAQAATGANAAVSAAPFLAAGSDTQTGIKLMIEAILMSPSFIWRTELGPSTLAADANGNYPTTSLTPYEVAAQLGFTFLGSTPDDALEAAAADTSANGLGSVTGIQAQVDRLLALPAVKQNLTTIVAGWFNIGQVFLKQHDTSFLTGVSMADQTTQTGIQNDLYASAQQFINDTLWTKSGKVTDLLSANKVFLNSRLAALYPEVTFANGAPTSLTTFVQGTWPATENRVGLITDPSYFWAQSDPAANSIVKRGKAMHDDVICADGIPPPPDLTTGHNAMVLALGDSEITKSDARLSNTPCNGCHTQMDPYARVMQHFNPIGGYRATDEVQRPIDTSVKFSGGPLDGQAIAGPAELATALAASGNVSGCAVQKISGYVIGSEIETYDTCEVNTLRDAFNKTDGTLSSLFRTVIVADFARARAGGTK